MVDKTQRRGQRVKARGFGGVDAGRAYPHPTLKGFCPFLPFRFSLINVAFQKSVSAILGRQRITNCKKEITSSNLRPVGGGGAGHERQAWGALSFGLGVLWSSLCCSFLEQRG